MIKGKPMPGVPTDLNLIAKIGKHLSTLSFIPEKNKIY